MLARVDSWWTIFKICLAERLVYRGDFALGTLMRFLPIVTQIFLWTAIFSAAGSGTIKGYTKEDVVAYYLLTMLARAFSSMPGLASGVARQVREGEIKKFFIQPIDLVGYLLLARVAHKIVYYLVAAGPFALVYYLCRVLCVSTVARLGVLARFLSRSDDGHDLLLVLGSHFTALCLHAVYVLFLRPHVSIRILTTTVENLCGFHAF